MPQSFQVPTSMIKPELSSFTTYKTFASGPDSYRGFCSNCGSSITHNDEVGFTEIWLGSIDTQFLAGMKQSDAVETKFGIMSKRSGGFEQSLCKASGHFWLDNAIIGVTDNVVGPKYWPAKSAGQPFDEDKMAFWRRVDEQSRAVISE